RGLRIDVTREEHDDAWLEVTMRLVKHHDRMEALLVLHQLLDIEELGVLLRHDPDSDILDAARALVDEPDGLLVRLLAGGLVGTLIDSRFQLRFQLLDDRLEIDILGQRDRAGEGAAAHLDRFRVLSRCRPGHQHHSETDDEQSWAHGCCAPLRQVSKQKRPGARPYPDAGTAGDGHSLVVLVIVKSCLTSFASITWPFLPSL